MLYHAFGLRLHSDRPLLGLVRATGGDADVRIRHDSAETDADADHAPAPPWREADAAAEPLSITVDPSTADFLLAYPDGTRFRVDAAGTRVHAATPADQTIEDTATYLLGPVMAFVLRLRGVVSLHAAAVVHDGRAILLAGPPGSGKSTTAGAFARRGMAVLTDDVAPLRAGADGCIEAGAAYPRVRLWPESARILCGDDDALPPLTPNWDKRYLDVPPPARDAAPVAAVYVLAPRVAADDAPRVEPLEGRDAVVSLVGNSYGGTRMDRAMRRRDFQVLSALARQAKIRRVVPHADPARLDALCDAVLADASALAPAA